MKKILALITSVALATVLFLETLGLIHTGPTVFSFLVGMWLMANAVFMASLINKGQRSKGKPALPKEVLKTGSMIKIADNHFYSFLEGETRILIIPVFIIDLAKEIDRTDPVYIRLTTDQFGGIGSACRITTGYNYIWNGDKLIPATQ